jgi:hypothetical protein
MEEILHKIPIQNLNLHWCPILIWKHTVTYTSLDHDQKTQPLIIHCGATFKFTLKSIIFNMLNVKHRVIGIQLAEKGTVLTASHVSEKSVKWHSMVSCSVCDRPWISSINHIKSILCQRFKGDLLRGRILINTDLYWLILDKEPDICGIYAELHGNINHLTKMELTVEADYSDCCS